MLTCRDARLNPAKFAGPAEGDVHVILYAGDVVHGPGSRARDSFEWHTIANQAQSVTDDVTRIRQHPLVRL